ncbi:alpha amylase, catalytic domain protein [Paenibacillus sp. FSL R7-277]|uniref:carbohydrate binding domain-containing protein n=1 Tax=Paenibacillus sp. FSL R7-277 TaxID=1227352 RepID=UPI0003E21D61|nr:carbohydrate binding domain-containing protein [Paenibacillus sp. FSL R7-277]ETT72516.1 alpha amylase, catalytic domain protein [Paenibacillus sp. FSL R7-277]
MKRKRNRLLVPVLIASIVLSIMMNLFVLPPAKVEAASIGTVTENDTIYQIMVDRFHDGDSSNNATGAAIRYGENSEEDFRYMKGGDWQGVIDKLPYIHNMGYTAIWISPVAEPQMTNRENNGTGKNTAYHGYNVKDPNKANPYFGTKEKLKELVDSAHALGIKVIIDVVPNHIGDYMLGTQAYYDIPSLQPAAPFNNPAWYHHNGDINWSLADGRYDQWAQDYLENHDLGGLDDIDFDVPVAKQAIFSSIKGWFDYTEADGARVDAAKLMKPTDIGELQNLLGVNTFGENFDGNAEFVSRWVGQNKEWGMLDFPLFFSVLNSFAYGQSFDANIKGTLAQDSYYGGNANHMVTFIDNHDRNRFLTEAGGSVEKLQNALSFIFTVRGTPVVFQGTEQNKGNGNGQIMTGGIADTWNRWSMVKRDASGNVLENYFNENASTFKHVAKLNEIRKNNPALRTGTQREMWSAQNLYAFSRRIDSGTNVGQEVISAFSNASGGSQTVTLPLRAESTLTAGTVLVNQLNPSDTVTVQAGGVTGKQITITLGANSAKIYAKTQPVTDTQAPSVPGNVTATVQNASSALVSWSASTDNVGVTGYEIYRNGVKIGTSATTSFTDNGLVGSTNYSYTVKAYDAAMNLSAFSAAALIVTPAGNSVTIYYKQGYTNPYIHYRPVGGTWTTSPGVAIPAAEVAGYNKITINIGAATQLEACFNNGSGTWDSNGGSNYLFGTGTWTYTPTGNIQAGGPVTPTATPTVAPTATPTVTPTVAPTVAPTATPTVAPSATPTASPTVAPTATPVPTATPAGNTATIYYKNTAFSNSYIHYKLDGATTWTTSPGVQMQASTFSGYKAITIPLGSATGLTAAFNNGSGTWDNNGGNNYHFGTGSSSLVGGSLTSGEPQADSVTFRVSVPGSTPANAPVYLTGSFNSWNAADAAYLLTRGSDGVYSITLNLPAGSAVTYKLTRGSWGTVETVSSGADIANRTLTPAGGAQTVTLSVQRWKDQ